MTHTYAATYSTGLGAIVETALKKDIPDIEITGHDDGLIVFKTADTYENMVQISYLNNIFVCFAYEPTLGKEKSPHAIVKYLTPKATFARLPGKTFRLMVMQGSNLVHVTREITNKLKDKVMAQSGLVFSPLKAQIELWVLIRNSGAVMFGYKKEEKKEKKDTQKGELKSNIAELLVMASDPQPDDVFLDPFAGYGSIPQARINLEPFQKIILCDKNNQMAEKLKARFKENKAIEIHKANSLKLEFLKKECIDVIVTDPPWGIYEEEVLDMPVFYTKMLTEFTRLLKPEGKMVILTGQPEAFQVAIQENNELLVKEEYTTLVNGKKATIYVIGKVLVA